MPQDNGGQAFPNKGWGAGYEGMTLLDYFAGRVIEGMLKSGEWIEDHPDKVAKDAYRYSASMIKEKRRREEEGD